MIFKTLQNNKKSDLSAFSLIEIASVVIIVGLLIGGVIVGQRMVSLARLTNAQTLTNSSPVNIIEDLSMWLESTSKKSFINSQRVDGNSVTTWNDINPQLTTKHNAEAASAPTYDENGINNLPALNFNGSNDRLVFDPTDFLLNSDLTIFIVDKKADDNINKYLIAGSSNISDERFNLGYGNGTKNVSFIIANDGTSATFTDNYINPRIHTVTHSSTNGKNYYINGDLKTSEPANTTDATISVTFYYIGFRQANSHLYYGGHIGEIIIYSRELSEFERSQIEEYLSKKWKIALD